MLQSKRPCLSAQPFALKLGTEGRVQRSLRASPARLAGESDVQIKMIVHVFPYHTATTIPPACTAAAAASWKPDIPVQADDARFLRR